MPEQHKPKLLLRLATCLSVVLSGAACTTYREIPPDTSAEPVATARSTTDVQKIADLERQMAEKQRQCLADKRRLETTLKENQKQNEELQKKLDGLLAIDRELRNRNKTK
ncbi:MAG: hypothetical protein Q8S26_08135 [Azonexus sp.]|nr:hypothetical protein [Azonexus sp.]